MKKQRFIRMLVSLLVILSFIIVSACSSNNGNGSSNGGNTGSSQSNETGGNGADVEAEEEPFPISIMMQSFDADLPDNSSPVIQALEAYTNTKVEIRFVPDSAYGDTFNITMAGADLPTIIVAGKTPSFINAVRSGAFWELGPYLKDYPNLSLANEVVLNNASIDGKTYGIYRARTLGRNGVTVRKDWLENLGMDIPTTIDEFYDMLWAFTYNDPDGNNIDDTYGTVISKWHGPWDIMQLWFGVPNGWGEDENGNLVPAHQYPEYVEALRFFKKMYDEGLVNEDFAVMDSGIWTNPIINGEAGSIVDVADQAQRIDDKIKEIHPDLEAIDVFGGVSGEHGLRLLPTIGYNDMLAIPKDSVKTEEELRRVLDFIDKLNDEDMQILLANGIEGRQYELEDGYMVPTEDPTMARENRNLNQMLMFIPEDRSIPVKLTPVREKVAEVQASNVPHVIGNPAQPLVSDTYAQSGQQLDNIILDARVQFIVGQIDEAGLEEANQLWLRTGGDKYIEEINELYRATLQ